MGTAPL